MSQRDAFSSAAAISNDLKSIVERCSPSLVRIDDGSRLTATGVIWSDAGVIVTTSHGVERDEDLVVECHDGAVIPAILVGRDPDTDIAVVRIDSTDIVPIGRAGSESAGIGSLVLAIARPGLSGLQATLGIVTARTETQSGGRSEYVLHTDAEMYPGFSGGALVDMEGNLLGMTNLLFGRGRGTAVGAPVVDNVATALIANGRVTRGYLGVRTQEVAVPGAVSENLKGSQTRALLIVQVESGSPADVSGLLLGDTILKIGDVPIHNVDALRQQLRLMAPGTETELEFIRGGEIRRQSVVLGTE